jgi:bifunctional DNase/RNase
MQKIRLEIIGLSSGQTHGSYTLILGEEIGERKLPIIIGSFEAQAIAIEIEKIVPFRPMTHDLFVSFCKTFDIEVEEALIYNLVEGVFYSKIVCRQNGKPYEIDARTSDAIALAVRFKCPIYVSSDIMESAGIVIQDEEQDNSPSRPSVNEPPAKKSGKSDEDLTKTSLEDLEMLLEKALKVEDYNKAAIIRDEINRRRA